MSDVKYREFAQWTTGGKVEIIKYVSLSDYDALADQLIRVLGKYADPLAAAQTANEHTKVCEERDALRARLASAEEALRLVLPDRQALRNTRAAARAHFAKYPT
jgi:hypothetical protein